MEIVPDDEDEVLIEAIPLSSRSPTIIDFKIHKEGKKTYFKIIRADEIALDDKTQGRKNDDEMFRVDDLVGEKVVMKTTTGEHEEHIIEDVSTVEPVPTAGEVVTTTVKDSVAPTTDVTEDEITMAQALAALNSIKPKVVVQEQEMSTIILVATTTVTTAVPTPRAPKVLFFMNKNNHKYLLSLHQRIKAKLR
nr:hypothetical protein [Tanacetum cinerariifolium]